MSAPKLSEANFITMFESLGANGMSRETGLAPQNIYERRRSIEKRTGRILTPPTHRQKRMIVEHPGKLDAQVKDGIVLVGSDSHYWTGEPSTAHKAFVWACREFRPKIVIKNGDELDGAAISRHPPLRWVKVPTVQEEIAAVKDRHAEIIVAAEGADRYWPLGNHDARLEIKLASLVPEFDGVKGMMLADHFPDWQHCIMVVINDDVVIKHRFKGGIHATHNNALWAGKTMVTGHLHSLKVTPFSDYNGIRWGVDTGTMAEPYGPQFDYTELNPSNCRSGFIVLSFEDGELLDPEIVRVNAPGEVVFRGKKIRV